jgi:DNA-binding LacI/PurR family transcriptional regulator
VVAKTYTIRDVAEKAGVGIGTVSRVINNSPLVSEKTREKVLAAIEELDYHPSPVARQLSTGGRSQAIGIIAPFFTRPAYVGRLRGIETALLESQYDLILYNVETPEQRDNLFRRIPRERRVDGLVIITLHPTDEDVKLFKRYGMPIVLVDSEHPGLTSIIIDDIDGGRQGTQHLIDLGHQKIAFLSDYLDYPFGFGASQQRLKGYRQTLDSNNLTFIDQYHKQGDHSKEAAYRLTEELMTLPNPPTSIFTTSDTHALGCLEALQAMGLQVPGDVSVVGYDDIEVSAYIGLTTVCQPLYQSGIDGINTLMKVIDNGNNDLPSRSVTLPVNLVVRETTGPPP